MVRQNKQDMREEVMRMRLKGANAAKCLAFVIFVGESETPNKMGLVANQLFVTPYPRLVIWRWRETISMASSHRLPSYDSNGLTGIGVCLFCLVSVKYTWCSWGHGKFGYNHDHIVIHIYMMYI